MIKICQFNLYNFCNLSLINYYFRKFLLISTIKYKIFEKIEF